ncbi:hypothetical protein BDY19DRAFT_592991 [Irpex rosettiformis]|uniref:Uncharacterized protein n=1 Tax=Irpex rosettiformis TaxID=378272 RepID=A0ACB8UF60_9APHY|nr:hypothetical protein BDY19DRAFT_592991 [Irpex rosettiformis]
MVNARGYLFIFLNTVRVISIVSLLLLFSSSVVTMADDIKAVNRFIAAGKLDASSSNSTQVDTDYIEGSTVPNQPAGAFWAVLNSLLVIVQSIVCIFSECSWPERFFDTYFPVLGPAFGLGALGVIQCLLGAAVLSHHVAEFPLVSAFLVFSIGCLNILLGLIFRERVKTKRSIRKWKEGNKDVLPTTGRMPAYNITFPQHNASGSFDEKDSGAWRSGSLSSQKQGLGFGRKAEMAAAEQGYNVREPEESVPPYAAKPASRFSHGSAASGSEYSPTREGGYSRPASEHEHARGDAASPATHSGETAI